ncbi:MAG: hypothetical protein ACD_20C00064G0002 [uncultured bacterium]|nr:MAG: hypothetical protein ACD_20C00064G0002 [uncultured bacterium]
MLRVGFTPAQQNYRTNRQAQPNQNLAFGVNSGPKMLETLKEVVQGLTKTAETAELSKIEPHIEKAKRYMVLLKIAEKDNPNLTLDLKERSHGYISPIAHVEVTHLDYPGIKIQCKLVNDAERRNRLFDGSKFHEVVHPRFFAPSLTDAKFGEFMQEFIRTAAKEAPEKAVAEHKFSLVEGMNNLLAEITGKKPINNL